MSGFKVLPSYTDLTSFTLTEDISHPHDHLPLLLHAQVGGDRLVDLDHDIQAVPMLDMEAGLQGPDQPYIFPWEQEQVHNVQDTLNSQPSIISGGYYPPSWSCGGKFLVDGVEEEDTLDLSTTSTILSYSYSPPPGPPPTQLNSRLTILPPRPQLMETQMIPEPIHHHHHQHQQHMQQPQLLSHPQQPPALASTSIKHEKERRVRARPRSAQEASVLVDRPCKVCGERAGKHSYYGGQVCPSCRAFFRRSVQSGYNNTYYCVKEGDCEVNLKTRKNCQYCRYKLCEMAGMKTSWVLTEEERKLKFAGKGKKRKDRVVSGSGSSVSAVSESLSPDPTELNSMPMLGLCDTDMAEIQGHVLTSGCYEASRVGDMDTTLIRKIIRIIAFKASLDVDGQTQLRQVINSRCHKLVTKTEEFSGLNEKDQTMLLSSNLSLVTSLQTCVMFPAHLQWSHQLAPLLGETEVDKLNTKLRSLCVLGLDDLHLDYGQFFGLPPGLVKGEESYERFHKLISDIGSWHQDPTEMVLLSLVIFYSSDMLDLSDRTRVEQTQLNYVLLLQKYISVRHQTDSEVSRRRFTKAMMLVVMIREMIDILANAATGHLDTLQEL